MNAITDITGFGFTGHLLEMLEKTEYSAVITKEKVPVIDAAKQFAKQFVFPDNTTRNYNAQSEFISGLIDLDLLLFCDPQTSGGLLFSVNRNHENEMDSFLNDKNQYFSKIGSIKTGQEKKINFI